jgi:hypothetical protein
MASITYIEHQGQRIDLETAERHTEYKCDKDGQFLDLADRVMLEVRVIAPGGRQATLWVDCHVHDTAATACQVAERLLAAVLP